MAVFPGTNQLVEQIFARVITVAFIAKLRPALEDTTRFGMAGSRIRVVFVNFQPALIQTKIHPSGDHVVAATLPRQTQTRPEDFRNIEQRQQVIVLHHLVSGMKIHQMQLVGSLDQLLLGGVGDGKILRRIAVNYVAVGLHIGALQRVLLIEPFPLKQRFIFQPRAANGQRFAANIRLRQAVLGLVGLDHPAEDCGVVKGITKGIAAVFDHQRQFAGPLLAGRQRGVNHILLGDPDPILVKLSNHCHMSGSAKLAAFLPDQQRARFRRAAGTVGKRL